MAKCSRVFVPEEEGIFPIMRSVAENRQFLICGREQR